MSQLHKATQIHPEVVWVDSSFADLIPGFLEKRRQDIATMQEALYRGDFQTIQTLAHQMKGSGGGYGFDVISEIGAGLEQAARERDAGNVCKWILQLATYLRHVKVNYA